MRGRVFVAVLALIGLLSAASIGYAAYLVSRDSVGLPVTKLQPAPSKIAPQSARRKRGSTRTQTRGVTTRPVTTVEDRRGGGRRGRDDNSGRGSGSGSSGSGSSGSGGSGHGGGDD